MLIPTATYRIQFYRAFGFRSARSVISYLDNLGISHLYASPIFKARKGSLHGYDMVDPNRLNPELGASSDFEALSEELKRKKIGWIQDIVPNHMAFSHENRLLTDLFENGKESAYRHYFDIDWDHPVESMRAESRLIAPFLGSPYGEVLEGWQIKLKYDEAGFAVNYSDLAFPLKIGSYVKLLTDRLSLLRETLGENHPDFIGLLGIIENLNKLPSRKETNERHKEIANIKKALWEIYSGNQSIRRFIDSNICVVNGEKGKPESFDRLDDLLSEQVFRLSFWKVANEEVNYRRFFHLNDLICLRAEDKTVFNNAHALIFRLIKEGTVSGLRIDHIDGLYDPALYLKRLRGTAGQIYIVVEKILERNEELPSRWPMQGTTGYEFLNAVGGVFCQRQNDKEFTRIYTNFTGIENFTTDLVCEKKRLVIKEHMGGDLDNLVRLLMKISRRHRHGVDITFRGARKALMEVLVRFPVYRTYIDRSVFINTDRYYQNRHYIDQSVKEAARAHPELHRELMFVKRTLLFENKFEKPEEKDQWLHFVMKFQQFTGPLMAKGFEDTLLYVYNRLISLNEVGGSLDGLGYSLEEFHDFNRKRAIFWPNSLNATSTHDTKRGEDSRARINVLSELPQEWERRIKTWSLLNEKKKKKRLREGAVPDRNTEYFLYQTLIGAFPFEENEYFPFVERIKAYVVKAAREAKIHTRWSKPDKDYEDACVSFVEAILDRSEENQFLQNFLPFFRKISFYGIFNSLSQTLIKITAPGVPDFYQGSELWDLNLVDPDNRRPVDFEKRSAFLKEILEKSHSDIRSTVRDLLHSKEDGRIKLFLIHMSLTARRENPEIFQTQNYIPLKAGGRWKENVIAFARPHDKKVGADHNS